MNDLFSIQNIERYYPLYVVGITSQPDYKTNPLDQNKKDSMRRKAANTDLIFKTLSQIERGMSKSFHFDLELEGPL